MRTNTSTDSNPETRGFNDLQFTTSVYYVPRRSRPIKRFPFFALALLLLAGYGLAWLFGEIFK